MSVTDTLIHHNFSLNVQILREFVHMVAIVTHQLPSFYQSPLSVESHIIHMTEPIYIQHYTLIYILFFFFLSSDASEAETVHLPGWETAGRKGGEDDGGKEEFEFYSDAFPKAAAVNQRERGQTGEVATKSLLGFYSLVTPHKPELVNFITFTN